MNRCEVCQKQAPRRCGLCQRAFYCNKQHQTEHWVQHKHVCKAFKVCEGEDQHGYLSATRTINPGDFILQELPLIWGPCLSTVPVCLGCGKKIDAETSRPCFKCGWPVCDELCEKSPGHLPECRYTSQKGERVAIKKFGVPHLIYKCVTVLRCLYMKQFLPKNWKRVEKLKTYKGKGHQENEWAKIAEFIRRFFKLYSVFSFEEVMEVCGLVRMNSHEVPLTDPSYIAIFGTASLIEHDCSANCTISFTSLGQIVVSAAKPIEEGDHLTISYVNPLLGTSSRRYHLYENRFFWCHCQRCEDPTEFGTNFSALKCQTTNCDGHILPPTFTDSKKLPDWVCAKCRQPMSSYLVQDILERAEKDLGELDKNDVEECKNFLRTYEGYLYKNHFHNVGVKWFLVQFLGRESVETLNDDDLILKLQLCQDLEDLVKVLAPAEKRVLGRVLFEKSGVISELCSRSGPGKLLSLNESRKILEEVLELLKNESSAMMEGKIFKEAKKRLENVNQLLQIVDNNEVCQK